MHLDPAILSNFGRRCPLLYKALYGRRYLLPQKYQAVSRNQDRGLQRRILVLLEGYVEPERA